LTLTSRFEITERTII